MLELLGKLYIFSHFLCIGIACACSVQLVTSCLSFSLYLRWYFIDDISPDVRRGMQKALELRRHIASGLGSWNNIFCDRCF